MDKRVEKILHERKEIQEAIIKAAEWINKKYAGKDLVLVGLLKGCLPFLGQLISYVTVECTVELLTIESSWVGTVDSNQEPKVVYDSTKQNLKDKDVLIVDEIIDSAHTLKFVKEYLNKKYQPLSIGFITLLDKPEGRKIPLDPDYSCFTVENKWIVGYGCDLGGRMRNLPYVAILKQDK